VNNIPKSSDKPVPFKIASMFTAFKYKNFRLWFGGQLGAQSGVWMQNMVLSYLVYEMTDSAAYLGYTGFALGVPSLFLTLFGGAVADRVPRRSLLMATQTWFMLASFGLAFLLFTEVLLPWQILLFSVVMGIGVAFNGPAGQAIIVNLVRSKDLTNAIALNSSMLNAATIIGPALAGVFYALAGPDWCILISGLGFLWAVFTLFRIKIEAPAPRTNNRSVFRDVWNGLLYIRTEKAILMLLIGFALFCIFEIAVMILMPAWAVKVLGGGVETNGMLLTSRGLGALAGSFLIAALSQRYNKGKLLSLSTLLLPGIIIAFALVRWLPLSLLIVAIEGTGFIVFATTTNALLQERVTEDMRARVMSVYTLILMGGMPVGSLLSGTLAELIGESVTLIISAIILLGLAVWWRLRWPEVRQMV
jgi:MFS family permease